MRDNKMFLFVLYPFVVLYPDLLHLDAKIDPQIQHVIIERKVYVCIISVCMCAKQLW